MAKYRAAFKYLIDIERGAMTVAVPKLILAILIAWLVIIYALFAIFAVGSGEPKVRAVFGMVSGLLLLWVLAGGGIMYLFRDRLRAFVQRLPGDWRLKFVAFATFLALIEEAVTTGMTNLAPVFGVKPGEAYITASANYADVVLFHSVVVFVPMFIAWAWLLSRYDFSPFTVFLLFGLTGTLCEAGTFGPQNLTMFGMWVFVYGLMAYLPAYALPRDRGAREPKAWHYALAVIIPILAAIPVAVVVSLLHPVALHFPKL